MAVHAATRRAVQRALVLLAARSRAVGFSWIDVADKEQTVLSFARCDGDQHAVIVLNLTPVPRTAYRIGAPASGSYRYALSSDDERFGGSGFERPDVAATVDHPYHGFQQSMLLALPPLSAIVLLPEPGTVERADDEGAVPLGVPVAVLLEPVGDVTSPRKRRSKAGSKVAEHEPRQKSAPKSGKTNADKLKAAKPKTAKPKTDKAKPRDKPKPGDKS